MKFIVKKSSEILVVNWPYEFQMYLVYSICKILHQTKEEAVHTKEFHQK